MFENISYIIINILLSITLAASFIVIFYFTYVKNIEEKIVVNNVKYTIDQLGDSILPIFSPTDKEKLLESLKEIKLPDINEADEYVLTENKKLEKTAYTYITLLIVIIFSIVTILLIFNPKYNILEIVIKNLILLGFIGLTEYLFLTFFISKYISANPSKILSKIISNFAENPSKKIIENDDNSKEYLAAKFISKYLNLSKKQN
jgi:hypothetical protein